MEKDTTDASTTTTIKMTTIAQGFWDWEDRSFYVDNEDHFPKDDGSHQATLEEEEEEEEEGRKPPGNHVHPQLNDSTVEESSFWMPQERTNAANKNNDMENIGLEEEDMVEETAKGSGSNSIAPAANTTVAAIGKSDKWNKKWQDNYEEFARFRKEQKAVPNRLRSWSGRQRKHYREGKLLFEKQNKLRAIGFELGERKIKAIGYVNWNRLMEELREYYQTWGTCNVGKNNLNGDTTLNQWMNYQQFFFKKYKSGGFDTSVNKSKYQERLRQLNELGFEEHYPI